MDTFFEQIIKIKKTGKTWVGYIGIALAAILVMTFAIRYLPEISIVIIALTLYGAYKLYSLMSIEYEYIITNSSMDIDKIISKSSRKRVMSFDLSAVERIEKYRKDLPKDLLNDVFFACNLNDENAFVMVIHPEGKAKKTVVIAPDERMRDAMVKFLPKFISDSIK